jgi:hypothetical protein
MSTNEGVREGVFSSFSSLSVSEGVAAEEMESDEHEESGHSDDDVDEDEINHSELSKETVRANSPKYRAQKSDIWKHVRRITIHDLPDRGMNAEYTHVCVYRLDDGGDGEKRFYNTPLKLFSFVQQEGGGMEHDDRAHTFQEEV